MPMAMVHCVWLSPITISDLPFIPAGGSAGMAICDAIITIGAQ